MFCSNLMMSISRKLTNSLPLLGYIVLKAFNLTNIKGKKKDGVKTDKKETNIEHGFAYMSIK